jgi:18S rRNA (guanine1575-N7)-methyltransferase
MLIASAAMSVGFTGGLVVDYPNSSKAKKHYLCLCSGEQSFSVPAPISGGGGGASSGGGFHQGAAPGGGGREKKGRRKDRVAVKSRDWIQAKKERERRKGKETRRDSKYTGRKRASGF